jgi:hypothetical protein
MPYSDTIASRYFRMAVAEAVMACKLSSHIFRRFYLPDSFMQDEVKAIMDELYSVSPRREAIFRMQLLSGYKPEIVQSHIENVVRLAVEEVVNTLDPLLFSEDAKQNYRSELEKHYQEGTTLWQQIQWNEKRGIVENSPSPDWEEIEDYNTDVSPELSMDQMLIDPDDPIMSLFPRLRIDGILEPLCIGYALWPNQNIVIAGFAEYNINSRNAANGHTGGSARGGRAPKRTDRRESVVSNLSVGVGRADDSPVSPRAISGAHFLPGVPNGSRRVIQGARMGVEYI